jgi:eukaryotic-like serine/threonine-protein kinase
MPTQAHPAVGDYVLLETLGSGTMGAVYLAEHRLFGYKVAIKRLHDHLRNDAEVVARFCGEAEIASRVRNRGLVHFFESGQDDSGCSYLVMELLEGKCLGSLLAGGPLPQPFAVEIARQIATTLDAAHRAGVVHRDLKPENVQLVRDPSGQSSVQVKVLDFGVAKLDDDERTRVGSVFGTPLYMAPELCRGAVAATPASDVYALGCLLYQMLCGRPPFQGNLQAVLFAQLSEEPAPPGHVQPGIGPEIESLLLAMLAKDPARRPPSMERVAAALKIIGRELSAPPRPLAQGSSPALALDAYVPASPDIPVHCTARITRPPRRKSQGGRLRAVLLLLAVGLGCAAAGSSFALYQLDRVLAAEPSSR